MPVFDPSMTSIGDVPELHILNAAVQLNETARALRQSGGLNASAARWTAAVAILTGAAAILGTV